jgi:phosphopantetheine binding protein
VTDGGDLDSAAGSATAILREDFSAAGGDSLLAVRLILRMRAVFDCDLSVKEIHNHRSVSGFTELPTQAILGDSESEAGSLFRDAGRAA